MNKLFVLAGRLADAPKRIANAKACNDIMRGFRLGADSTDSLNRSEVPPPVKRSEVPLPVKRSEVPLPVNRSEVPPPVKRSEVPLPVNRSEVPPPVKRSEVPLLEEKPLWKETHSVKRSKCNFVRKQASK